MFTRKVLTILGLSLLLLPLQKVLGILEQPVESAKGQLLEQEPIPNDIHVTRHVDGFLVTWEAVPGYNSYELSVYNDEENLHNVEVTATQGLVPASAYTVGERITISVHPLNIDGTKSGGGAIIVSAPLPLSSDDETQDPVSEQIPLNVRSISQPDGIHLTWEAVPGAQAYKIEIQIWDRSGGSVSPRPDYHTTVATTRAVIPTSVYGVGYGLQVFVRAVTTPPSYFYGYHAFIVQSPTTLLYLGGGSGGGYLDTFLLGAIGKAYRVSEYQIDLYEIIEGTTQGVFALRITQAEVDRALAVAGEATCVKASRNDRASVTVWADGNVTLSIGPDYETKIFHVLLESGLGGPIIGHSTTYGPPAGAHCPN